MRKVRSFDQDPPVHPATAHPLYLLASQRIPQGLLLYLANPNYT